MKQPDPRSRDNGPKGPSLHREGCGAVSPPLVSLVVLTYNRASLAVECVASLKKLRYAPVEILVVDNGSTDDSVRQLKEIEGISVISTGANLGFAAGMNAGFRAAAGRYVAALNNDVTVSERWLDEAIDIMENDPAIGIVSCRQMSYYDPRLIDSLYSYLHPSLIFFQEGFHGRWAEGNETSQCGRVLGVSGASTIYRKNLLDDMHGFDESFGSYHEESDLCMRAFLAGWKCVYVPTAVVFHRRSESFGRIPGTMFYFQTRNRLWFIYKYSPLWLVVANLGWILFTELRILRIMVFRERVFLTYCRGLFDGFLGMRRLRAARRENMRSLAKKLAEYNMLRKKRIIPL